MSRKLTREEFIERSTKIHGRLYDYSKVDYVNNQTNVIISCSIHGDFQMLPSNHLAGRGCRYCAFDRKRKPNYKYGTNDVLNGTLCQAYTYWHSMMTRCYDPILHKRIPAYKGCIECDEWHKLSSFKSWFENPQNGYKTGYCLDKDVLFKGNKIYSPETCLFLPKEINSMFTTKRRYRSNLPLGVQKHHNRYSAVSSVNHKTKFIGAFATPEEAFAAYKVFKETRLKNIATEYFNRGDITQKAYNALMSYTFDITD